MIVKKLNLEMKMKKILIEIMKLQHIIDLPEKN
jgi:hypothetical protein